MKPTRNKLLLSSIVLTGMAASASADTIVWDGLGDGSTYTDGNNWGGTAPTDDLTTDIAQLTGDTVTLDVDRQVSGLDINAATTLTGTGTRLTLGTGGLTGAADLTLSGGVILRTGTVSSATGGVTIDGSVLEVATAAQGFIGTGTVTLDNGGMIFDATNQNLNMSSTTSIVLGAGGGVFRNASNKAFYGLGNAVISGAGQLTLDGGGSTNYAGNSRIQISSGGNANTFTGGTLMTNKANVQVNNDDDFGAVAGKVTIDDARFVTENNISFDAAREFEIASGGGRISLNNKTSTINGLLSGSGDLTIDGQIRNDNGGSPGGILNITSVGNTLTGNVTIGENTVVQWGQNSQAIGNNVQVTLDGGTIGANGNAHLDLGAITNIVLTENGGTLRQRSGRNIYNLNNKVISGDGALTLSGTGGHSGRIQMETSNNTYTGGTILNEGVLVRFNSNDSLGDAAGSITFDNGTMQNNDSNLTLGDRAIIIEDGGARIIAGWINRSISSTGVVSGTGKLEVVNDNSVVQLGGGSNTYSGGTDVNGTLWSKTGSIGTGDVTLNNSNTARGHLKNWEGATTHSNNIIIGTDGGTLSAGWSSALTLTGELSGDGNLRIQGDSGTVVLSNASTNYAGDIVLEDATSRLSLAGGTYSGEISGDAASTLTITGDVTLEGANTLTSASSVTSGNTLIINGSSSSTLITVDSGATLGGSGTVAAATVNGTLAVGNSPGSMTFGTLTLAGTTIMEIDGNNGAGVTGGHDQASVSGALTYAGALTLDIGTMFTEGSYSWTLFNITGSETGDFSSVALADQYSGSFVFDSSDIWNYSTATETWSFTQSTGVLDLTVVTVVPEPSAALLCALSLLALLRRRRA
ncbi:MAG: hypothetical protein NWR51_04340 [Akkermansiaceae bacterium]|nr:hypothetical protein [Akkermansiaceae bacterium]MDP4846472.1 hypothetical protein [Akkermansiaceae bacterium]MDP4896516.1 hypothetical protein [Akkermansiaceae bacterium]